MLLRKSPVLASSFVCAVVAGSPRAEPAGEEDPPELDGDLRSTFPQLQEGPKK